MIRYTTHWMGPINMDWIKKNGGHWAGGRIDISGIDNEAMSLPVMHQDDYRTFSDWLRAFETDDVWTLAQLVEAYEKQHPKIRWFEK